MYMQSNLVGVPFNFRQNPQAYDHHPVEKSAHESQWASYLIQQNQKFMQGGKMRFTPQQMEVLNQNPFIKQQIAKLSSDNRQLRTHIAQLQKELQQSKVDVQGYQEQVEIFKEELRQSKVAVQEYQLQVERFKEELQNYQNDPAEMVRLKTELKKVRLEALQKAKYHAEVQLLQLQLQACRTELQKHLERGVEAESYQTRPQQEKSEYQIERQMYRAEADRLREELNQLREREQYWRKCVQWLTSNHCKQIAELRLKYLVEMQKLTHQGTGLARSVFRAK